MTTSVYDGDGYFTVAYDLPSECLGFCFFNPKDDAELAKKKAKTRSEISKLRHKFRNVVLQWGRFINNSVFAVPNVCYPAVEKAIGLAREDYRVLNETLKAEYNQVVEYDIATLAFSKDENTVIQEKAKRVLLGELNKTCDTLDGRINNLAKKGKGTTPKSVQTAHAGLDDLLGIVQKFKLGEDADIKALVEQVSLKINDLGNLTKKP